MANKICTPQYLNSKGEKSADYYGNLHLGHDEALKIYLKRNAHQVMTKFQKGRLTLEELKEQANKIRENDVNDFQRVTTFLQSGFDEFQAASRAKQVVTNKYVRKLITEAENPKIYNHTVDDVKHKRFKYTPGSLVMDEATTWADSGEGIKEAEELTEFWESLTSSGTTTHKYLEDFINSYTKFRDEYKDTKSDSDILDLAIAEAIDEAVYKIF